MTRARANVENVATLLERALRAGLAVGWNALAAPRGRDGAVWCSGSPSRGGELMTPDVLFDLASLTKPLVTTTLLLLARRDGLDLETPLAELLPELAASPWCSVSLVQCATHSAGFPAWAPLYALGGCSREAYLRALAQLEPIAAPGTRVEYSCPGFLALGLALERRGGADLAALFDKGVATLLGVAGELQFAPGNERSVAGGEARWFVEADLLARRGLTGEPPPARAGVAPCDDGNARGLGGVGGNAGLFGTAAAVAALAVEYLPGGGRLLTATEAALATSCRTAGLEQARGLGWQLAATPGCSAGAALPASAFGHTGFTGVSVWADPVSSRVYVLLGNRLHPGGRTPDLHPLRRRFHALASRQHVRAEGSAGL
jgi:CubicO group peptidase (beta-lactamase class C family)